MIVYNGVEFKNLPDSDYYISRDGDILSVKHVIPDKGQSIKLVRKGHRVRRKVEQLVKVVWK